MGRFSMTGQVIVMKCIAIIKTNVKDKRDHYLKVMVVGMHTGKQSKQNSKDWMGQKNSF